MAVTFSRTVSFADRLAALASPVVTGSVLVLVVNDHVLKQQFPGWVTGKLSDVAGVALVALLIGLILGRPRFSVMATALGFVALKTVPGVAELAAPVLGGVTSRDPTDVIAIAILPFALNWLTYRTEYRSISAHRVLASSCLLLSMFAIAATDCDGVTRQSLVTDGSSIWVGETRAYDPATSISTTDAGGMTWLRSIDGGLTFVASSPPVQTATTEQTEVCLSTGTCVRVIADEWVEERRPGGIWKPAYGFGRAERTSLGLDLKDRCGRTTKFSAVVVTKTSVGESVVVQMGEQGLLYRSPAGRWEQRAVGAAKPSVAGTTAPVHSPQVPRWQRQLGRLSFFPATFGAVLTTLLWRRSSRLARAVLFISTLVGGVSFVLVMIADELVQDGFQPENERPFALPVAAWTLFVISIGYAIYERDVRKRSRSDIEVELSKRADGSEREVLRWSHGDESTGDARRAHVCLYRHQSLYRVHRSTRRCRCRRRLGRLSNGRTTNRQPPRCARRQMAR